MSLSGQCLVLPFPPSINKYYRSVPIGGRVQVKISKDGRDYRKATIACVHDLCGGKPVALEARVQCHVEVWQPDRRRRDLDNMLKALLDALTHSGIWNDDSQIDDLRITRLGLDRTNPRVIVTIYELPELETI